MDCWQMDSGTAALLLLPFLLVPRLAVCNASLPPVLLMRHPVGNFSSSSSSSHLYLNFGRGGQGQQVVGSRMPSAAATMVYYPCPVQLVANNQHYWRRRCAQPAGWWTTYGQPGRWTTSQSVQRPVPATPPPTPSPTLSSPQPSFPLQGALIRLIFPPGSNFPFSPLGPSTSAATTEPTTETTTSPPTPTSMVSIRTANPATSFVVIGFGTFPTVLTTKSKSTTTSTTTTMTELPTPPPYSPPQNGPIGPPETIVRANPCPEGQPFFNEYRNPQTCNFVVKPNGGCPEDHWCHTGGSFETTTCCPGTPNKRCEMGKRIGEGDELIPRWYFDAQERKCKRFLYKGMRGNANNFVTAIDCYDKCENAAQMGAPLAAMLSPCAIGEPARDLNGRQFKCGTSDSRCPAGYYCHLGESPQWNVCCELSTGVADRCNLALRIGEGGGRLSRFYFDTVSRKCSQFMYKGTKGNENQFLTLDECRTICERPLNPCPMLYDFGERKECQTESEGQGRCARDEWCHIGSSRELTACCPAAAVHPCKLPLDLGQGVENLPRWYAVPSDDPCARECRPFQYRGMKGNQNNFLSRADCEAHCKAECPMALNPCADEEQLLDPEGRPQRCDGRGQCPTDYWCHQGAGADTTVCCSGAGRACSQPLAEGFGNALLSRWYFNANNGNCQKFVYKGIGGNQNNYVNYDDCMNACPELRGSNTSNASSVSALPFLPFSSSSPPPPTSTLAAAPKRPSPSAPPSVPSTGGHDADNPCGGDQFPLLVDGGEGAGAVPVLFRCSPLTLCPDSHFCHISDQPKLSNQCCPKDGDPCAQPVSQGVGQSALTRFHFDQVQRHCLPFLYNGARGNANNFLSAEDCEYVCLGPSASKAKRPNPCGRGQHPLMAANDEPLVCGGTGEEKEQEGGGCPPGYWCHVGSSPETTNCCPGDGEKQCGLPLELGEGTERLDRWYFDGKAAACRRFWYTGLKGNANNFLSLEQCLQKCLPFATRSNYAAAIGIGINSSQRKPERAESNFCLRGEPFRDGNGELVKCGLEGEEGDGKCPANHFCHLGHTAAQSGCCPRTSALDRCLLSLNRGLKATGGGTTQTHIRWHFKSASHRCEAFDYAGQKGNENNFVTKRHCQEQCLAKVPPSQQNRKPLRGQICPHGEPKWEQQQEVEGGRRPTACGRDGECPEGFVCHLSAEAGMAVCCENPAYFCLEPRDAGPCSGSFVRFGYNPLTDTCVSYSYGGCGGTLNQFHTQEQCTEICCRQFRSRRASSAEVSRKDQ